MRIKAFYNLIIAFFLVSHVCASPSHTHEHSARTSTARSKADAKPKSAKVAEAKLKHGRGAPSLRFGSRRVSTRSPASRSNTHGTLTGVRHTYDRPVRLPALKRRRRRLNRGRTLSTSRITASFISRPKRISFRAKPAPPIFSRRLRQTTQICSSNPRRSRPPSRLL